LLNVELFINLTGKVVNNINTDRNRDRIELYNTFILAIATMGVAWCSYQATLWGGIQTFRLAESNKYSRLAQQKMIQSGQNKAMEEGVIINFVDAVFANNQSKIDYILKGVRPELATILSDWMKLQPLQNDTSPRHPMVMPEYEKLMEKRIDESKQMTDRADAAFKKGEDANYNSDRYSFLGVVFSMVMFLGAIVTKLLRAGPRLGLAVISTLICFVAIVWVLCCLPIAHKGE